MGSFHKRTQLGGSFNSTSKRWGGALNQNIGCRSGKKNQHLIQLIYRLQRGPFKMTSLELLGNIEFICYISCLKSAKGKLLYWAVRKVSRRRYLLWVGIDEMIREWTDRAGNIWPEKRSKTRALLMKSRKKIKMLFWKPRELWTLTSHLDESVKQKFSAGEFVLQVSVVGWYRGMYVSSGTLHLTWLYTLKFCIHEHSWMSVDKSGDTGGV